MIGVQVEDSETQRDIWCVLERKLFSNRAIMFLVSGQPPIIERLTVRRGRRVLHRTHLQYSLTLAVIANAHGYGSGITGDLHAVLRAYGANDATASPTVVSSVEHGKYHSLAATAFSRLSK